MYTEKNFNLPSMDGLSDKQITAHLKLYAGYVKNTNLLLEKFNSDSLSNPEKAELQRRFGFEFNGMRLHELYFSGLGGDGDENKAPELLEKITEQFGSYEKWKASFLEIGKMRGIGWVVLYHDKDSGKLLQTWVSDHELGHLAGIDIIIALDVWEHAFLLDYMPSERGDYLNAYFNNLNWEVINKRI